MPAGNNTGSNSDYRVSDPPPTAQALMMMSSGLATALLGTGIAAFACVVAHRRPLAVLGFLVTAVGLGLAFAGLRQVRAAVDAFFPTRRDLSVARKSLGGARQDADAACGGVTPGVLYQLDPWEQHDCPEEWPAPCTVEFLKEDAVVASVGIFTTKCHVNLTETGADLKSKSLGGYSVVVTPFG